MTQPEPTAAMTATDLAGQVYTRILGILSNRIWTGAETLNDVTLAQSLGVSCTPVRLALAKLANQGLVRKMPGKGWVPIALTLKDIRDIFEIKEALEAQAVRRAAELIHPLLPKSFGAWSSRCTRLSHDATCGAGSRPMIAFTSCSSRSTATSA